MNSDNETTRAEDGKKVATSCYVTCTNLLYKAWHKMRGSRKNLRGWIRKLCEPLTFVTLLLFFATLALYFATRNLVKDSELTAERQLRSYIYIFPVTVVTFKADLAPLVLFSVKNYGATPTRNGRARFGFAVSASNPEHDYTVPDNSMIVSREAIGFPPSGSSDGIPLRLRGKDANAETMTQKEILQVYEQGYVLVVKGAFIYDDIFKIERHTRFCYWFDREQISSIQVSPDKQLLGGSSAGICKYGNEED